MTVGFNERFEQYQEASNEAQDQAAEATKTDAERRAAQAIEMAEQVKAYVLEAIAFLEANGVNPLDHYRSVGEPADHYEYSGQVWPAFVLPLEGKKYDEDLRPTHKEEPVVLGSDGKIYHGQGRSSKRYPRQKDGTEYPAEPGIEAAFDLVEYTPSMALSMITARPPTMSSKYYTEDNLGQDFRDKLFYVIESPERPLDRIRAAAKEEREKLEEERRKQATAANRQNQREQAAAQQQAGEQAAIETLLRDLNLPVIVERAATQLAYGEGEVILPLPGIHRDRKPNCTGNCSEDSAVRNALQERAKAKGMDTELRVNPNNPSGWPTHYIIARSTVNRTATASHQEVDKLVAAHAAADHEHHKREQAAINTAAQQLRPALDKAVKAAKKPGEPESFKMIKPSPFNPFRQWGLKRTTRTTLHDGMFPLNVTTKALAELAGDYPNHILTCKQDQRNRIIIYVERKPTTPRT